MSAGATLIDAGAATSWAETDVIKADVISRVIV